MLVYPQLGSGALSQFPVRRRRKLRTVANYTADGRAIKLPDPAGAVTEWSLQYSGLTDDEAAALEQFFAAAEGTLNGFTFLDPTSNLLAWSDHLNEAAWQRGPLVTVADGISDPNGGTRAWHAANTGGGAQTIGQTIAAPAGYLYCLSAYARSTQAVTVTMLLGANRTDKEIGAQWTRIVAAAHGDPATESITLGLELPAGAAIDVFGIQAEPQGGASAYQSSTSGGVYENARLRDDALTIVDTDVNCHSCTVNIIHANHL
jgi:hypothetical protein